MSALEQCLRDAFDKGAGEIVVCVGRYGKDGKAESFQALVRSADVNVPQGVGILGDPGKALLRAIEDAAAQREARNTPAATAGVFG